MNNRDYHAWSRHQIDRLAYLLSERMSAAVIATKMNCSKATVHRQTKKLERAVFGDRAELSANTKGE